VVLRLGEGLARTAGSLCVYISVYIDQTVCVLCIGVLYTTGSVWYIQK
jgi:hypothetical protein